MRLLATPCTGSTAISASGSTAGAASAPACAGTPITSVSGNLVCFRRRGRQQCLIQGLIHKNNSAMQYKRDSRISYVFFLPVPRPPLRTHRMTCLVKKGLLWSLRVSTEGSFFVRLSRSASNEVFVGATAPHMALSDFSVVGWHARRLTSGRPAAAAARKAQKPTTGVAPTQQLVVPPCIRV